MDQANTSIKRRVVTNASSLSAASSAQLKHARSKIERRRRDLLRRINYRNTLTVVVLPAIVTIYLLTTLNVVLPNTSTLIFSCIYFNVTLLAFTAGYHKYFTHNTFQTNSKALEFLFVFFGSSLGMGSVRWWATFHRAHHQFTDDTVRDPYSIKRGFLWAHWGWLIKKPKITAFYDEYMELEFPLTACSDNTEPLLAELNEVLADANTEAIAELIRPRPTHQALINWHEKYYFACFLASTFVIPVAVTVLWLDDTLISAFLYPVVIRMFLAQQCVLSTESLCHKPYIFLIPTQPFSDKNSSRNLHNPLFTLLTFGQANQNYHHEFPHDYRNSSSMFAFDPTKWFIWTLYKVGIVSDIFKTPKDLIMQLRVQQQQTIINRTKSQLNWGTPISKLPRISPSGFKRILANSNHQNDRIYIVIQNIIHDITPFMDQHPGGVPLLKASHGKDATKAFFGGVYGHLTAAINLLATMRIGILDVGNEEEVWRRVVKEEGIVQDERLQGDSSQYKSAEAA